MATVAVQRATRAGVAPTYNAASGGGDKFAPGANTYLHVKNGGGSAITATVVTPATARDLAVADVAVSVPNGGERIIGPFPHDLFEGSDGLVAVTWSATASVTFAVVEVR